MVSVYHYWSDWKYTIRLLQLSYWRDETHFFPRSFLAGSESTYFTQINHFRYLRKSLKSLQRAHFFTFGCDTKYTTFSKTPEKNNSEFPTILKRLFLISIKELREKSLDDPPKYTPYLGGSSKDFSLNSFIEIRKRRFKISLFDGCCYILYFNLKTLKAVFYF